MTRTARTFYDDPRQRDSPIGPVQHSRLMSHILGRRILITPLDPFGHHGFRAHCIVSGERRLAFSVQHFDLRH